MQKPYLLLLLAASLALSACSKNGSATSEEEIEQFFASVKVEDGRPAAMKKDSFGVTSYLLTVHGYPDNLSVCQSLITMHKASDEGSAVDGNFYCIPIEEQK